MSDLLQVSVPLAKVGDFCPNKQCCDYGKVQTWIRGAARHAEAVEEVC